jgi:hypothetical protein
MKLVVGKIVTDSINCGRIVPPNYKQKQGSLNWWSEIFEKFYGRRQLGLAFTA